MHSKALLGLLIVLSFYALYDFLSTKKYECITVESKLGLVFLTNVLTLSSLINILLIYELDLHFAVYIALLLALCILIQYLTTYFAGYRYKIPYPNTEELSVMLKNVLWYQGYKDVEQIVEYRENKFSFPGEKKSIELEFREGFFSKSNFHYLKFKRWVDRESRETITEALDAKLEPYEPDMPSTLFKSIELLFIIIFLVGFIGFYNYQALQPEEIQVYDDASRLEALMLTDYDISVTDPSIINSFEDQFENSNAYHAKHITSKSMDASVIKVNYGDPYRTLFIGPKYSYLYVDYEDLRKVSSLDNIMVSVYNLYGNKKGIYYSLYPNGSLYNELTRIIRNN